MDDFHQTPNMHPNLNVPPNDQYFRLSKINEIKDYFVTKIKERKLVSKGLKKYMASFDYFNELLIVLSVTTCSISIASFATVIGVSLRMVSACFSVAFSICTGIVKKTVGNNQRLKKKKKKHNKIVMLAKSKLNTESKITEALINN